MFYIFEGEVTAGTNITCACTRKCRQQKTNYTQEELEEEIKEMKAKLTVAKNTTSKYTRTKMSARDDRTSSVVVGTAASVVMVVIFGGIVLADLFTIVRIIGRNVCRR